MGIFSRSNTQVTSANTTNNAYDQRQVFDASGGGLIAGEGAFVAVDGNDYLSQFFSDSSDRSTTNIDGSNRSSTWSDNSNRSTTTINATDPGLVRIAQLNAELLDGLSDDSQGTVRALANMGTDTIKSLGQSVTSLYAQAGSNSTTAWSNTIDASERLLDKVLQTAQGTSEAANVTARAAVSAYTPTDSKLGDALKWAALATAAVFALRAFSKA